MVEANEEKIRDELIYFAWKKKETKKNEWSCNYSMMNLYATNIELHVNHLNNHL